MGYLDTNIRQMKIDQYRQYIINHASNVARAFDKYGKELCEILDASYDLVQTKITRHDESKMSCEEFVAYRKRFYPCEDESISDEEFNVAWLHHINNNDHHPEHWIIPKDGENIILDMPPECIVEMLCDWQSFSYTGRGNAYTFYYKVDRKEGLMSPATRKKVERCLELFKED